MVLRLRLLVALVVIALLGWLALGPLHRVMRASLANYRALSHATPDVDGLAIGARLPPLAGAWVNGGPVGPDSLGRRLTAVVVFSDVRPATLDLLPRLEELQEGFAREGLRVVGVHVPEFAFAADTAVTARLARRLGVRFPVVLDGSRELERRLGAIDRSGRPRAIVVDSAARVVAQSATDPEDVVREGVARLIPGVPVDLSRADAEDPPSPPRFLPLGVGRVAAGPLAHAEAGDTRTYTAQFRYQEQGRPEVPYPVGRWTSDAEGLSAARGGAAQFLAMRYDAPRSGPARVGVVMSPPREGPVRVWVLRDEHWLPREALGADARLDAHGASYVEVSEPRLYLVGRGGGVYKLSPEAPGLVVHAFTLESRSPRE